MPQRSVLTTLLCLCLAGCTTWVDRVDPRSDAPERRNVAPSPYVGPASYADALRDWSAPEDLNAWIGSRFEYDRIRAMQLSETQRQRNAPLAIHSPDAFFERPSGVCVDLARFAVETLSRVAPALEARYVMIEFDPVSLAGNLLRRHWLVSYESAGQLYFFADSKRPGVVVGPYANLQGFAADYARYRGRSIVSIAVRTSYQRQLKTRASKQARSDASALTPGLSRVD